MPRSQATLVVMLRSQRYKIQLIHYRTAIKGWLIRLQYWWLTVEKERLIPWSILGLIPLLLAVAIWQAIDFQRTSVENGPSSNETQHTGVRTQQHSRELHCLALNVYHEARGEPRAGQFAVAEVTMNRVASKRFPNTVCDVVHEKRWDRIRKRYVGAFSWTELESVSTSDSKAWERAMEVAERVYHEQEKPRVNGALFYHARHIRPSWARKKTRVARLGRHYFYR